MGKQACMNQKKVKKDKRLDPVSTMVRLRCDMPCIKCRKSSRRLDVSHAMSSVRGHLRAFPTCANAAQTHPEWQLGKRRSGACAKCGIKSFDASQQLLAAVSGRDAPPGQPSAQTMLIRSIQRGYQRPDREYLSARCPAAFQPLRKQALDLAVRSAERHFRSRCAHRPKYSVSFRK